MRKIFALFVLGVIVGFSVPTCADEYVHGYMRSNGTYVHSYYRSSPDDTVTNNFSFKGNVNPYTGAVGTNRYIHDITSPYYERPDIHGRIGHNGAPAVDRPPPQDFRNLGSVVDLCPPPHFRMTEQDGCQPVGRSSVIDLCPPPHRMTVPDGCQP